MAEGDDHVPSEVVQRLTAALGPERVYLFGSRVGRRLVGQ